MTQVQMQQKLALLPLTAPVTVEGEIDEDGIPRLSMTYPLVPSGSSNVTIHVNHTEQQLRDLVNNLPLAAADKLASLAIMLIPV